MFRKLMLAGLMTATVLGGVAPAYAQRGDHDGRGGRGNGDSQRQADRGQNRGQERRSNVPRQEAMRQARAQAEQPRAVRPVQQPDRQRAEGRWRGNGGPAVAATTAPAWRQARQDGRNDRRDIRQYGRQDQPVARQDWRSDRQVDRQDGRQAQRDTRQDWRGDRQDDRRDNRGSNWNNRGSSNWNDNGRRYDDRTRWSNQQRWNNGWRQDRRYDWQSYRNRYGDRYRAGRYYAPRGWNYGYRRFSVGIFLSSLLYSNSYWLDDPYSYRLPPAYGSLRWVRYYDDALLVDVRDGYVVDVIRDFFW
jgi:hypothetical protein